MSDLPALDHHPLAVWDEPVSERRPPTASVLATLEWRQAAGFAFILAGAIAILVAWWGVSGTLDPGKQMPYLASGGLGGAAAVAIGVTLLISYEHARDRAALATILRRLDDLEGRLPALGKTNGDAANESSPARRAPTPRKRAAR